MPNDPHGHEAVLSANLHIRRLARALAYGDVSADDIEQESWAAALRSGHADALGASRAWWSTVVRRVALNLRRSGGRRRARERHAARSDADTGAGPFDLALFEERRCELVAAMETLPHAQREVLAARYWQGLEPTEIARRRGERPEAVRQRLARAHASLRDRLDRRGIDRRAWLAPLMGFQGPPPVAAAGAAIGIGGLLMKNAIILSASLLMLLVGVWSWNRWTDLEPTLTPEGVATVPSASREPGRSVQEPTPSPARVSAASAAADVDDPRPRLIRGADAVSNVAYWRDERPFRMHHGQPPVDASRTDADGRFSLPHDSPGDWLWFSVDPSHAFCVPLAEWRGGDVRLPSWRRVSVEIRGLPVDGSWTLSCGPAATANTEGFAGVQGVDRLDAGKHGPLWLLRRSQRKTGEASAQARFVAIEGMPYDYFASSTEYEILPRAQLASMDDRIVFHSGVPRTVYAFEVYESDGITRSDIKCRAVLSYASGSTGRVFERGEGKVSHRAHERGKYTHLSVVLHDGEVFTFETAGLAERGPLRLVRGTGRSAVARVRVPEEMDAWPDRDIGLLYEGRLRDTDDFEGLDPASKYRNVSVWRNGEDFVVQASSEHDLEARLLLMAGDGRFALQQGNRMVEMPAAELQPIDLAWLVAQHAEGTSTDLLMVWHEVKLDDVANSRDDGWITVAVWRVFRTPHHGWRLQRELGPDDHLPIPPALVQRAPIRSRSRLVIHVSDVGADVTIPLLPR